MFDKYPGNNEIKLPPEEKMYFEEGGKLYLPSANILSFLSAQNSESAVKRFYDSRQYKKIAGAMLSYVDIEPLRIPLTRNGKRIVFDGTFGEEGRDIWLDKRVARLDKGVANPKERPVVGLPWELKFRLTLLPSHEITIDEVHRLFVDGGLAIGLGTYRGLFGKFEVARWERVV